jgi:hypothetical protein
MIPPQQALLACLTLKLFSIARKSHVMPFVADEGLAFFAGLNTIPKKSYLSEYSSRISHDQTNQVLLDFHRCVQSEALFEGQSFNLDFHSVPFFGDDPLVERHYVSMRSRSQKSVLGGPGSALLLAQDALRQRWLGPGTSGSGATRWHEALAGRHESSYLSIWTRLAAQRHPRGSLRSNGSLVGRARGRAALDGPREELTEVNSS